MTATTIYLRFDDRAAALAALAPFGLVAVDPDTGEAIFVSTAWPDDTRVDAALVGGDGIDRRRTVPTPVEDPEDGSSEGSGGDVVPGFHVDLLWSRGPVPDFGAAVIEPVTPSQVFAT